MAAARSRTGASRRRRRRSGGLGRARRGCARQGWRSPGGGASTRWPATKTFAGDG
ncbi:hypothetical protein FH972_026833 [Carpinus fangiana]|uniref:Uncharacterized protein n=1 Tax=Carpinus fangiana TaxID=176857 RepID=A0A5N6L5J6_9ROSI|nr:hypothetical protein FH972_026833 [Carpinus fangiana]